MKCKVCENEFEPWGPKALFCSRSCAAKFNNKGRVRSEESKAKTSRAVRRALGLPEDKPVKEIPPPEQKRTREEYNAHMKEYMLKRHHRRREAALKQLGGRCVVCGCDDEAKLNFDHVDASTRSWGICKRIAGLAEAKLQEELKKCQILCEHCHQRKTIEAGELDNKGVNNPSAKLTEEQVLEARRRWKPYDKENGAEALAHEFGVSATTMAMAIKRKTWKHI